MQVTFIIITTSLTLPLTSSFPISLYPCLLPPFHALFPLKPPFPLLPSLPPSLPLHYHTTIPFARPCCLLLTSLPPSLLL